MKRWIDVKNKSEFHIVTRYTTARFRIPFGTYDLLGFIQ